MIAQLTHDLGDKTGSRARVIWAALAAVAAIGVVDYATGYRVSVSLFYLVPVLLVTWYAGAAAGIAMSLLSMSTWLFADMLARRADFTNIVLLWNAFVRLGFFLVVTYLAWRLKRALAYERGLARIDHLTELANSRSFYDVAEREIDRSMRYDRPLTVAYLDVDDFKSVNDRFGHHEGDLLLREAARLIRRSVRSTDTVGRLGGDEFAILFPETDNEQAREVVERLRDSFRRLSNQTRWEATFSIGVVTYPTPPPSAHDLIRTADQMMYRAKREGKNRCKFGTQTRSGRVDSQPRPADGATNPRPAEVSHDG